MKAIIDGVMLELTPQEFLELRRTQDSSETIPALLKPIISTPFKRSRGSKNWNAKETAALIETYEKGKSLRLLAQRLSRPIHSIYTRASRLKLTKKHKYMTRKDAKVPYPQPVSPEDEVRAVTAKNRNFTMPERIDINTVADGLQSIFWDVVKVVIANKGTLSYLRDAYPLGIVDAGNWRSFVNEFMSKSKKIAEYFGVPNLFSRRIVKSKYWEIVYGDTHG